MSYKLEKPYTDEQYADFVVEHNHNNGRMIEETDTAVYALEAWEKLEGDEVIDNTEEYEREQVQKERERIAMLSLTAADVERAIYKTRGMDFDDLIAAVQAAPVAENGTPAGIDIKALKIELRANNFYRGNPYIEQVGALLGFTSNELDYLFENKELPEKIS